MSPLQLAFHMGFEQVILIGVDHTYSAQGKPNTTVVSQGEDKDHFHAGYFGKGFRWQLPDLETSEQGYLLGTQGLRSSRTAGDRRHNRWEAENLSKSRIRLSSDDRKTVSLPRNP